MSQHTEFVNGTYNFPSKPRNQWEIGLKLGSFQVSGDVPTQFAFPSFGAHVRKAFGYIFKDFIIHNKTWYGKTWGRFVCHILTALFIA